MKDQLISQEDLRILHPLFRERYGETLIDAGIRLSRLNNANDIYDRAKHLTGISFCRDLLDNLKIRRVIRNPGILEKYKNQPFITISNHPYGHIDGIPVIPIHISGRNSIPFYLSRVFGWRVRDLLLCHELKNKEGREIVITVGDAILPESIQIIHDNAKLGKYLRQRTYDLAQ